MENYQLDTVRAAIEPYLVATPEQLDLVTLWAAHTHVYDAFHASPRLSIRSMAPRCGKSTLLAIVKCLSARGEHIGHTTGPSLYTLIDQEHPTVIMDEADQVWGKSGFSKAMKVVQAVMNDGYTRDGTARVTRGGESVKLSTFGPAAFGGIGRLPEAMSSRSLPVMLTSGTPAEVFDSALEGAELTMLSQDLNLWLRQEDVMRQLKAASPRPEVAGIGDPRTRQIMAPLIAIADIAGGDWPERAVKAARFAFLGLTDTPLLSRPQMALRDAMDYWPADTAVLSGTEIMSALVCMPESTWGSVFTLGTRSGERFLATLLRTVGVEAGNHSAGGAQTWGYSREALCDAVKLHLDV